MNTLSLVQLGTFILGIAVLIVIHEMGHFLAARLCKVGVEEFGIGFPPRCSLFHAGATVFVELDPAGWFCAHQRGE